MDQNYADFITVVTIVNVRNSSLTLKTNYHEAVPFSVYLRVWISDYLAVVKETYLRFRKPFLYSRLSVSYQKRPIHLWRTLFRQLSIVCCSCS